MVGVGSASGRRASGPAPVGSARMGSEVWPADSCRPARWGWLIAAGRATARRATLFMNYEPAGHSNRRQVSAGVQSATRNGWRPSSQSSSPSPQTGSRDGLEIEKSGQRLCALATRDGAPDGRPARRSSIKRPPGAQLAASPELRFVARPLCGSPPPTHARQAPAMVVSHNPGESEVRAPSPLAAARQHRALGVSAYTHWRETRPVLERLHKRPAIAGQSKHTSRASPVAGCLRFRLRL
jgi:hypothetical protein